MHGNVILLPETRAPQMYQNDSQQPEFADFYLPFGGKLLASNRWVKLGAMVPWQEVEQCYQASFKGSGMGAPAKSGRIAMGALIIKERLGITDEETVMQIAENPYLQHFLGLHEYRQEPLFDPSMMVHFRSRFGQGDYQRINDKIIGEATGHGQSGLQDPGEEKQSDQEEPQAPNEGKMLIDATCTPADITYPTDLKLLNEAREKCEGYIDKLHAPDVGKSKKPRDYREKARRQYLAVAKQKRPGARKIRKAIGQQLRFLKRDLGHIDTMLGKGARVSLLSRYERRCLKTIRILYRQQLTMYEERIHTVADRIVSISQPYVRPIVRGKAGKKVEFGAKISISHFKGGYVALDRLSWDAYNEGGDLIEQVEGYKKRWGYYPASVHADTIYRTRKNRKYCKEHGIRFTGVKLGRPRKETEENKKQLKAEKKQRRQDEVDRIPVEGKFGEAKRKGTLDRIMAKLAHTSESVIHVGVIVLNLDKWLRELIFWLKTSVGAGHTIIRAVHGTLRMALGVRLNPSASPFPTSPGCSNHSLAA